MLLISLDQTPIICLEQMEQFGPGFEITSTTLTPSLYDVLEYDGKIVVSGEFDRIGSKSISGVAAWNGTEWEALGMGLSGSILGSAPVIFPHQLLEFEGDLIVAGNFLRADGIDVNGVARWDGVSWSAMGDGFDAPAYGLGIWMGDLYAGGEFDFSGATAVKKIAKWNGSDWIPAEFGVAGTSGFSFVHTFYTNDILYVGGGFDRFSSTSTGEVPVSGIFSWDGVNALFYDGGPGYDIEAILVYEDSLWAGGGSFGFGWIGVHEVEFAVGHSDVEVSDYFSLYPNPARNHLHLEMGIPVQRIQIAGVDGRVLKVLNPNSSSSMDIDVSSWESGMYVVKYESEGSSFSSLLRVE